MIQQQLSLPRSLPRKKTLLSVFCATALVFATGIQAIPGRPSGTETHMTMHGEPKYQEGFKHFEHVNPDAPKGGTLRMTSMGTFDSLNPFIDKGSSAIGLGYLYDTLMMHSFDEPFSTYPLVAQYVEQAPDNSSITFHLNPKARFHDGAPITAEDVVFSLNILKEKGAPFYRAYYGDIKKAEALSKLSVRFVFKHNQNRELPLIISQLTVLPKHFWEKEENDFAAANMSLPLGSGPYRIKSVDSGRSIAFERVEDYWAKDLPTSVGRYNFDSIQFDYYRDENVALQAFKAGEHNLRYEYIARNWATAYDFPAVNSGKVHMESIPSLSPQGMQGFAYNTRREIFADPRVRKALMAALDFEWLNNNLFYGSYIRSKSYFSNSTMSATGLPEGDELALLEPWRKQLPEALFDEPYTVPVNDGSGQVRQHLKKSLRLLSEAGWNLDNGVLRNNRGEPFKFDILLVNASMERVALPFTRNLSLLGIDASVRVVDSSQYINRLRNYDFDMIVTVYPQSSSPGNEQKDFWGSQAADIPSSRNYIGIKSPVVDSLIETVINAGSRVDLETAVKALDRVLLWGEYIIPQWHFPFDRIAYWEPLRHPFRSDKSDSEAPVLYRMDLDSWWMDPDVKVPAPDQNPQPEAESSSGGTWLYLLLAALILAGWILQKRSNRKNN